MGEPRKVGGKWEEDIYWTRFQYIHFSRRLLAGFHQQLAIPRKFADKLKKKLPETVVLKGPSGSTWNVGLTANGNTLLLKDGWQEFVKDHSLEKNDLLIFRYNGESRFEVLVFDPCSLCEKEASYFVKKSGEKKRKMSESSVQANSMISHDAVGSTSLDKCGSDYSFRLPAGCRGVVSHYSPKKIQRKAPPVKPSNAKLTSRNKEPSSTSGRRMKTQLDDGQTSTDGQCVSNGRPVTEEEKKMALESAHAASTHHSLMVVMRPAYVYMKFRMRIPTKWVADYLSPRSQDVFLRINEKTWRTRFYYNKASGCGELTTGWKDFAMDNHLEEFDVCVFVPFRRTKYCTFVMDVTIFRIVHKVTPPS